MDLPPLRAVLPLRDGRAVEGFTVSAEEALAWWRRLFSTCPSGYRPLVVDPSTAPELVEPRPDSRTFDENLALSAQLDGAALLEADIQKLLARPRTADTRRLRRELKGRGRWPDQPSRHRQDDLPAYRWESSLRTVLLMPVDASWQIPCLLDFGAWNAYPSPAVHSAILRHWHERYGADLLAMSFDTVDIAITRPPTTRPEARRAALEFEMYNEGAYDEYGSSLNDVAAGLLGADVWLAWWD